MRQPRFTRNAEELSRDLLRLFAPEFTSPSGKDVESIRLKKFQRLVVADEIAQLLQGDIPYFSTLVGQRHLTLSKGVAAGAFSQSGIEWSLSKMKEFQASDTAEQTALIELALGGSRETSELAPTLSEALADAANELAKEAFVPIDAPARWLGTVGDATVGELQVSSSLRDMFSGSLGITLAIEAATAASGSGPEAFLDREAGKWTDHLTHSKGSIAATPFTPLGYEGLGGVALVLSLIHI